MGLGEMNFLMNKPVAHLGLLVVFEGIDGSGKSSVSKWVIDELVSKEFRATYLFEPTRDGYGATIRDRMVYDLENFSVEEQASLFVLNRAQNKSKKIIPNLRQSKVVILDRYYYSSIAYQAATGKFSPETIYNFNKPVIMTPDIVIMFDVDVDKALARIKANRESSTDYEKKDFLEKAQTIYRSMKAFNIHTIDANQSYEKVCSDALNLVYFAIDRKNEMFTKYNASTNKIPRDKESNVEDFDSLWEVLYKEAYNIK